METKIKEYLDIVNGSKAYRTYITYGQALRAFLQIVGTDAPITTETYIHFLKAIRGMNPSTKTLYASAVSGFYTFCAAQDHSINLASLKTANRQYLQRAGTRLPTFNKAAIEKIITFAIDHRSNIIAYRDRAFVLCLADTGLRISEACGLLRGDIDWVEKRTFIIGKGNKEALVRISDRAIQAMQEYLAARAQMDGASGKPLASLPLFARHDFGAGKKIKPVQAHGMWAAVKELANKAGVNPAEIRVHDFRHYFVTKVYTASRDIKATKDLARHADISTTSRYTHLDGELDDLYKDVFN